MSMTGAILDRYFDQKTSTSYTGYLDPTKKNRLFKDALISLCERKWKNDFDQKEWDEISIITNTQVDVVPTNNLLETAGLQIVGVTVASATVFTITTLLPHELVAGESIIISGVSGTLTMPTANGLFTPTIITSTTFQITVASATGVYAVNTGIVSDQSTIGDYWHLLAIRPLFNTRLYNVSITGATNRSPIMVTFNTRTIIRKQSKIVISGVLGNTAANGIFYAKVVNDFSIQLYSDFQLQSPVSGNGNYVSGGIVSIVNDNYASPLTSKMKQGVLNVPTPVLPYYEIANNQIKIYPLDQTCASARLDYIRIPPVVIDVNDAVTDLTLYYPEKFLYAILDEAAILLGITMRDIELVQVEGIEQQKNP